MCNVLHAYQFSLKYRPGKDNQLADALSRLPLPATADDYDKCRLIEPGDVDFFLLEQVASHRSDRCVRRWLSKLVVFRRPLMSISLRCVVDRQRRTNQKKRYGSRYRSTYLIFRSST